MGEYRNCGISLFETKFGSDGNSIAEIIADWIQIDNKVVIAIDAPFGWPEDLGNSLNYHLAGQILSVESNLLFRRETDRFIKKTLGKQPLDVGADRIARTAYATLKIIGELQLIIKNKIEMAWSPDKVNAISVIEAYPSATDDYSLSENPVTQLYDYVEKIKSGKAKDKYRRIIKVSYCTKFYLYAVFDITASLEKTIRFNNFKHTPDNMGYYLFNVTYNAYVEILSFNKIIKDSKKRNRILFDKLDI